MTPRKKTALGFMITGIVFLAVGAITWFTQVDPVWLQKALLGIAALAEIVGVVILLP